MGRRGPAKSPAEKFQESMMQLWYRRVASKLFDRLELVVPCPYTALQLYQFGWTPEQRTALKALGSVKHLMRLTSELRFKVPATMMGMGVQTVRLNLPRKQPMTDGLPYGVRANGRGTHELFEEDLPPVVYQHMVDWLERAAVQKRLHVKMFIDYEQAVKACSRIGQMVKIWPVIGDIWKHDHGGRAEFSRIMKPRLGGMDADFAMRSQAHNEILASTFMLPEVPFRNFTLE